VVCDGGNTAWSAAAAVAESAARLEESCAKGPASTPSTLVRRCTYTMVYRARLWHQRACSKSRTAAANQKPWRSSSSTSASTAVPDGVLLELHLEEDGLRLHLHQRHGWGGAPERPPAAGEHRRASSILDGEAGDDVADERVGKEAEAVDVVEHGG
jgi:hypothetical protein